VLAVSSDADLAVEAVARISAVPTILRVISEITGLRLALVARVTPDSWTACAVLDRMDFGLVPGQKLDLATTLCRDVMMEKRAIVIDCVSDDARYRDHPTPKMYGFESYISVPIFRRDGSYFGNVCALDANPMRLKERGTLAMMELHAELIGLQLEAEERQRATQEALLDERTTAELREQFIAVLGHDIRTPLSAIVSGTELLASRPLPGPELAVVQRIRRSAGRIAMLVEDVLDFARGRLGDGIPLAMTEVDDLDAVFRQVVAEKRANFPAHEVRFRPTTVPTLRCDRGRMAQLLSNLLTNALQHSPEALPVEVVVRSEGQLVLRVSNGGEPIPDDVRERLFQPFVRHAGAGGGGLGLGLYIVSQIVKSHGGALRVASSREAGTSFECTIPIV
jgi:phosphoserine phosphatase RsbU/P